MPRFNFGIGRRFLWQDQVWQVRDHLENDVLLIENRQFGGQKRIARAELVAAWAGGELVGEIPAEDARSTPGQPLPTEYRITDFESLPEHLRAEAWRRYQIILPLLRRPPKERTRPAIYEYTDKLLAEQGRGDALALGGKRKRSAVGEALSRRSVERWLRTFERRDYDIRALVPATDRQGGQGQRRLDPAVEERLQNVLAECAARPQQRTARHVWYAVVSGVADDNRYRGPGDQLEIPSIATIYRRIHEVGADSVLRRRPSGLEAQAQRMVGPGPRDQVSRILERAEIDHTLGDVHLVDPDDGQVIGRPWITLCTDAYSGYPLGLYVGFEPPSYLTVRSCLLHAILPKPDCVTLYGTKHPWLAHGVPDQLVIDNGKELVGNSLDAACAQLKIDLRETPVQAPWYKGAIERFFRTLNTGLIHTLPGTTYSNPQARGDYDSERHAALSLPSFIRLLHLFLLDEYAQRKHRGAQGIPAELWAESARRFPPDLSHSAKEVTILLGQTEARVIGRHGIQFENLVYSAPALAPLRSALPKSTEVRFKFNPSDIGMIYVEDPTGHQGWIAVPALKADYAQGLPLWKHKRLQEARLAAGDRENPVELAESRAEIEREIEREYARTRTIRGRKKAARMLGVGAESEPARFSGPTPGETEPLPSVAGPPAALPAPVAVEPAPAPSPARPHRGRPKGSGGAAQGAHPAPRAAGELRPAGAPAAAGRPDPAPSGQAVPGGQVSPTGPAPRPGWGSDYGLPPARGSAPRGERP